MASLATFAAVQPTAVKSVSGSSIAGTKLHLKPSRQPMRSTSYRAGAVVAKYGDKSVYFDLEDLGNTTGQWDLYGSDAPSPYNPLQARIKHAYKVRILYKKASTVVEETKLDSESCSKEGAYVEVMMLEEPVHSPKSNDGNQRCVEQVFTQGFIKSFSGSREGLQPGINLEVDLAQSISNNLVSDPFSRPIEPCNVKPGCNGLLALCLNHSGHIRQSAAISKPLRNVKKKGKQKAHLEGFTTFSRLHGYKAVNKPTSKSIIYRPAAAAIAQSELSESESSLNNYLLQEATATIQLGKTLGINFNGQEDVALNKIMDLERKDKKRIIKEGKVKQ